MTAADGSTPPTSPGVKVELGAGTRRSSGRWQLGLGGWDALQAESPPRARSHGPLRVPSFEAPPAATPAAQRAQAVSPAPRGSAGAGSAGKSGGAPDRSPRAKGTAPTAALLPAPTRPAGRASTAGCNCKQSKCLKLYCVCFAKGGVCGPDCACLDCANKDPESEEVR